MLTGILFGIVAAYGISAIGYVFIILEAIHLPVEEEYLCCPIKNHVKL